MVQFGVLQYAAGPFFRAKFGERDRTEAPKLKESDYNLGRTTTTLRLEQADRG